MKTQALQRLASKLGCSSDTIVQGCPVDSDGDISNVGFIINCYDVLSDINIQNNKLRCSKYNFLGFRISDTANADEVHEEGQETFISGWSSFNS